MILHNTMDMYIKPRDKKEKRGGRGWMDARADGCRPTDVGASPVLSNGPPGTTVASRHTGPGPSCARQALVLPRLETARAFNQ